MRGAYLPTGCPAKKLEAPWKVRCMLAHLALLGRKVVVSVSTWESKSESRCEGMKSASD